METLHEMWQDRLGFSEETNECIIVLLIPERMQNEDDSSIDFDFRFQKLVLCIYQNAHKANEVVQSSAN